MDILEFKDLSITYKEKKAVKGVSFAVPENKIVALVGESGSGKSTLLRSVLNLLSADGSISQGNIFFRGKDMSKLSLKEMQSLRGREISMIFQDAGSYFNPRVKIGRQYLETLSAHLSFKKEELEVLAKETLRKLKLSDAERIMKSYPFQLSGGMLQRVAIAMAISLKPRLLLADEPTSALDVTVQAQVVQEILNLKKELNTAVLFVTHNMGVASKMADYIAVMKNGELMEFGSREQVIFHPESTYTKDLLEAVPKLEEEAKKK